MILTGNEFLGFTKKKKHDKIAYFLSVEKYLIWNPALNYVYPSQTHRI